MISKFTIKINQMKTLNNKLITCRQRYLFLCVCLALLSFGLSINKANAQERKWGEGRGNAVKQSEHRPSMDNRQNNVQRPDRRADVSSRPERRIEASPNNNNGYNRARDRSQNSDNGERVYNPGRRNKPDISPSSDNQQQGRGNRFNRNNSTANTYNNNNQAGNNNNSSSRRPNRVNEDATVNRNNSTVNNTRNVNRQVTNNNYHVSTRNIYTSSRPGNRPVYRYNYRPVYNAYNPCWRYSYLPARHSFYRSLPSVYFTINFGGFGYRYWDGVFYRPYNDLFSVCTPPIGIFINVLPVGYRTIYIRNYPYYYYNGTYYDQRGSDYYVVSPPVGAVVESLPDGYETVVIDGETYYTVDGAQYKPVVQDNGEIWYEVVKAN